MQRLSDEAFLDRALLAIEIVSPGDRTWQKLPFYADHHVDELLILDPPLAGSNWLRRTADGEYEPLASSRLIDLKPRELDQRLDRPPTDPEPGGGGQPEPGVTR